MLFKCSYFGLLNLEIQVWEMGWCWNCQQVFVWFGFVLRITAQWASAVSGGQLALPIYCVTCWNNANQTYVTEGKYAWSFSIKLEFWKDRMLNFCIVNMTSPEQWITQFVSIWILVTSLWGELREAVAVPKAWSQGGANSCISGKIPPALAAGPCAPPCVPRLGNQRDMSWRYVWCHDVTQRARGA